MGWPTTSRYDYDLRMRGAFARALAPNPDPHQVKEGFCYGYAHAEGEHPEGEYPEGEHGGEGRTTGWANSLSLSLSLTPNPNPNQESTLRAAPPAGLTTSPELTAGRTRRMG